MIIATIPLDFFSKERLEEIVLNASLTEEPTNGTVLLMAKRAVFIEMVSALCDKMFLYDSTNMKIDITKTVTEV